MNEKLPTKATLKEPKPYGDTATAIRYRTLFIEPKLDFGSDKKSVGLVVTDGSCNVMPAATWFETVEEAKQGIDVLIAVRGNSDMFWEIMQPFTYTPGDKSQHETCNIECGRFYAKVEKGIVVEVGEI